MPRVYSTKFIVKSKKGDNNLVFVNDIDEFEIVISENPCQLRLKKDRDFLHIKTCEIIKEGNEYDYNFKLLEDVDSKVEMMLILNKLKEKKDFTVPLIFSDVDRIDMGLILK